MTPAPPQPPRRPHQHVLHGMTREDPYHWLRRVDSPEVQAHLSAERAFYDAATAHLTSLVETLRSEMRARTPLTDSSVSWVHGDFSYYTRLPSGREHPQLMRYLNQAGDQGPEEVLLDLNEVAGEASYADLGVLLVSPDDRFLAWSCDLVGDEVFALRFRDLGTGRDLAEVVPRSYYGGAWSADSRVFLYTVHDDAYRPHQVWRHQLGTGVTDDVLVLEEPDARFELDLRATRSGGLVVVRAQSRDTSEVWVIDAARPTEPPRSVGGRRPGVEYDAEHLLGSEGENLLIVTNDGAVEFMLDRAPVPPPAGQDHTAWRVVRPEDPTERLERVDAFESHVVLTLRSGGRRLLRVLPVDDLAGRGRDIQPLFPAGTVTLGPNATYAAAAVTVEDQSSVRPRVWSDVDLRTLDRTVRHRQVAPGHRPEDYVCEVRSFPAEDGTLVPATLVRHRDVPLDGSAPALLYGYGAYEYTFEPEWDPGLPCLLDRGVVYVHAHVRGGGEGGRRWWLEGRLAHKENTFTDHLAVADGLADAGLVDGTRLATRGLSAGGLLQGAVLSRRPDRWRAVLAEVPFVDVVTTMLDPTIPLTVGEWDEWGDPRRAEDFAWMLAYSPYDNLPEPGRRPDVLVTGALHDARVMVWEPAKWVAALRHSDPQWASRCLFRVEIGAGAHSGPSGRFSRLGYEAEVQAWLVDTLVGDVAAHGGLG